MSDLRESATTEVQRQRESKETGSRLVKQSGSFEQAATAKTVQEAETIHEQSSSAFARDKYSHDLRVIRDLSLIIKLSCFLYLFIYLVMLAKESLKAF